MRIVQRKGIALKVGLIILSLLLLASCSEKTMTDSRFVLGTVCTITINGSDDEALMSSSFDLLYEIDRSISRFDENSWVYKINESAGKEGVSVPPGIFSLIERSLEMAERTDGVFNIVIDVCNAVCKGDGAPFERGGMPALGMIEDAVAHFEGKIEPLPVLFQLVHHAQRLLAVAKSRGVEGSEHALPHMAEGRVPQIVPQRDRLGKVLVEGKAAGDRSRDLRDVQRVRKTGHVVIAVGRKKDLRLVLQPQERLGIDDAVPVALKIRAHGTGGLVRKPSPAFA